MIFVFDQSAGYLLDLALYNKKGFVTADHKLVLLTNFELLQNFPETDCLILPELIYNNFFQLPGGCGITRSLSKILLKKNNGCQREALNSLFIVADPFSKNLLLVRC